ncbi:MAG: endolytic transglycosylase MltG [Eubacterium sp.]|nr:endolytic transglycosylase MltG [Eubacterium sp.]
MKKKKNKHSGVIAILVVILIIVIGLLGYFGYSVITNDINGKNQSSDEYTLVITKNDFEYEIGKKLYDNKIVVFDSLWTSWMSKHYPDFTYINGEYKLTADMSYEEIAKKLQNPDISHKTVKVAIPEGYNAMEIAKTLEENNICKADEFLEVCKSKEGFEYDWIKDIPDDELIAYPLEGFLFPATYDFAMNSDPKGIADAMLGTFDKRISDKWTKFCDENYMTVFELINLSSVVQEEAFGPESAGNIASVFINRLNKGAKLQSDVTYFYARDLRDEQGFSQKVYDSYYTYRCEGLPSGPISNPGEEIINAVVNHPDTDYLYFFSDLKKEFHFAKDYDEFVALQKKYPWK